MCIGRKINCNSIDEFLIGELMAFFMIETISVCHLMGINPFDQPAVEFGKKLTRDYLS